MPLSLRRLTLPGPLFATTLPVNAQAPASNSARPAAPSQLSPEERQRIDRLTRLDHADSDLGVGDDYRAARMPPVNTGLLDGNLAWRQHDGGHEDRSTMRDFIAWANRRLQHAAPAAIASAESPSPRL